MKAILFPLLAGLVLAAMHSAEAQSTVTNEMKRNRDRGKPGATQKKATAESVAASGVQKPGSAGAPPPLPPDAAPDAVIFTIDYNGAKERVVIKLLPEIAPKTVENFRKNIEAGAYEGMAFHRVIRNYIVQTGDPLSKDEAQKELWGTSDTGQKVPGEFRGKHKRWAVAMAHKPGENSSSGSQFYICLRPAGNLDGQYAVFGEVIHGTEVLNRLSGAVVDTNDVPVKRVGIADARLVRSDSKIAMGADVSGRKKTKPESQKGHIEKLIERVW
ncbi:MAG: peptidylprolyl isomerase [Verrucomicrobiales bacterium]